MNEWIKEIQFVKQIANELLSPRKTMYHDDYLIYKLSQNPHLRHQTFKTQNQFNQLLSATLIKHHEAKNQVCLIFLHGYGSNKQQGFSLVDYLPKCMDLCCFDFSSSGKSQGKVTTYGLKQFRDIRAIINELKKDTYGYKKFILWGRSMGAVSSFLMSSSQDKIDENLKKDIVYQVIDSAFSSFEAICYYQGKQAFKLPQPFISYGIDILKSTFKDNPPHLNPFNIDLVQISHHCSINTLFVYSQKDEIIPQQSMISIIEKLPSSILYQKLLISESHNSLRTHRTNLQIFKIVEKNYLKYLYNRNKNMLNFPNQSDSITNSMLDNSNYKRKIDVNKIKRFEKGISNSVKQSAKQSESTSGDIPQVQPAKKQKKFLELLSSIESKAKFNHIMKPKHHQNHQKIKKPIIHQFNEQSYLQIFKKLQKKKSTRIIDYPKSISKDIHQLRRTRTLDFDVSQYEANFMQPISNCQSLSRLRGMSSFASPNKTLKRSSEFTIQKNKSHKRALFCSLNKKKNSQLKFKSQTSQKEDQIILNFNTQHKH